MLFVAPLFMGGRHPLGQLVAALVALATAALWLARQAVLRDGGWIRTGCEWLLLAGLAVLLRTRFGVIAVIAASAAAGLAITLARG